MRVAVGSDHRGYQVKSRLLPLIQQLGHETVDVGAFDDQSVDYPDYAELVARRVANGEADRGILICGTGIGMNIVANKHFGVRATTVHDELTAEMCRRHNDVNVLCLSGDMIGERNIDNLIKIWLETKFDGGRHARRVDKILELESKAEGTRSD